MMGPTPPHQMCVLFFGSKQFGFVHLDKIVDFKENRERFAKNQKKHGLAFKTAVQNMDDFISDPVVNNFKFVPNKIGFDSRFPYNRNSRRMPSQNRSEEKFKSKLSDMFSVHWK